MRKLFKLLAACTLATLTSPALPHWPDQAPHQIAELGEFQFEGGGSIKNLKMSYVTHGKLNAAKSNAILIMHGFALNHHQFDHLIGPGKPFDSEKYFIVCTDELGSSQTTFEHSTSPTNSGLKMAFPKYNARDKVNAEHQLVTRALGISHLLVITGYSSGADNSVQFAVSYPDFVDGILPMGGGAMWGTQGFFYGPLMLSELETCASWNGGNYEQNPQQCATNALSWLIPYFFTREWWDQYVDTPEAYQKWRNHCGDIAMWDTPGLIPHLDAGSSIVLLAGIHAGCYELFGNESVSAIRDLKGKKVAVQYFGGGDHILLSSMLAYVGMKPKQDVTWIAGQSQRAAMGLFVEGNADAFLGFSQQSEELRQRKIGKVILNTSEDKPWSQYFCCMVAANREFVQRNPIATSRVLRAVLKATDMCSAEPERVARFLSDKLYEPRFQIGLKVMKRLPYDRWREANPEDTLRFYALRLYEVGMIKSTPQKIITQSTDWRFLNELKKALKA